MCFPELNIKPQSKQRLPWGYWSDINHQRAFMDDLGAKMGIRNLKEWHHVTLMHIKRNGGAALLEHYHTLTDALKAIYPQQHWVPWRLAKSQLGKGTRTFSKDQYLLLQYVKKVRNVEI